MLRASEIGMLSKRRHSINCRTDHSLRLHFFSLPLFFSPLASYFLYSLLLTSSFHASPLCSSHPFLHYLSSLHHYSPLLHSLSLITSSSPLFSCFLTSLFAYFVIFSPIISPPPLSRSQSPLSSLLTWCLISTSLLLFSAPHLASLLFLSSHPSPHLNSLLSAPILSSPPPLLRSSPPHLFSA